MVKSEKERIIENARKRAQRVAVKLKIPKICEKCSSEEELILCFRDNDVQNAEPKNLYYLCKPCNDVRRFPEGRKREDYSKCDICNKIRLCAPNLFDEQNICESCFHSYCRKNKIDEHEILFPVRFTPNGFPETLSRIWFYGRSKFRFKKEAFSKEEKKLKEEFRENYQKEVIKKVATYIHNQPIQKIKEMYNQMENDETKELFLEQIFPEDREKLLKLD